MVVFIVLSGKRLITPLLVPPWKILEKSPGGPTPGKNPSDAQDCIFTLGNLCLDNLDPTDNEYIFLWLSA